MMRAVRCLALAVVITGASLVPAASLAQAEGLPKPREFAVHMSADGVHARDSLASGRYRMQVRLPRRHSGLLMLVKPDRGYTRADLRADDRRRTPAANRRIRNNLRFFGGVDVHRGGSGVLWETLYAGRYWLIGFSTLKGFSIKTVHVHGAPFASSFPRVSATVDLIDRGRVRLDRTMPQTGRILIRNSSRRIDSVYFLPIRRGVSYREFLRAVVTSLEVV